VRILPTPKSAALAGGRTALPHHPQVAFAGPEAMGAARWLADQLGEKLRVAWGPTERWHDAQVILGLLADLVELGVAPPAWGASAALTSALGREQGYILDVTEDSAILTALSPDGLRHAAASFLQLAEPDGIPCGHIEDWPDFRFRAADWLLNAEINRWAYERGDGREALFERLRRKVDLAARHKLNLIWFDGFGWDPDRVPGYAEAVRGLARYARERGIRLAYSGYGGGYGAAYQRAEIYTGAYHGHVFENRRPYPDGELYDCIGHPAYEESWHYGTCLSNDALLDAKLVELTRFVKACEPGLLYIHDIDTGDWDLAAEAWLRRCEECHRRWPNDDAGAGDGMAGAYARWFRRVVEAVGAVESDGGDYHAERDCLLAFVGPVYTGAYEPDEAWDEECRYFETLSQLLGPAPNVQFGIREQLVSDRAPRLRVAELSARLEAVGNGHGVFVVSFAGGDGYYSDQPVSPSATLNSYFLGAETAYVVGLGGIAEPGQIVAAEYGWNASAPGAVRVADSRQEALEQLQSAREGALRPAELYATDGLLERACAELYGPCAAPMLAEVFSGGSEQRRPVVMTWYTVTRAVRRLRAGEEQDLAEGKDYWLSRRGASERSAGLVRRALACEDLDQWAEEDLGWLLRCIELGTAFAEGLAMTYEALASPEQSAEVGRYWETLLAHIREQFPRDWFDPLGGDIGAAEQTAELLLSVAQNINKAANDN